MFEMGVPRVAERHLSRQSGPVAGVFAWVASAGRPLAAFEFEVAVLCHLVQRLKRVPSLSDRQVNVGAVDDVYLTHGTADPIDACLHVVASRRYLDRELTTATNLPNLLAVDFDGVAAEDVAGTARRPVNENPS